jgi:hypothetical protein
VLLWLWLEAQPAQGGYLILTCTHRHHLNLARCSHGKCILRDLRCDSCTGVCRQLLEPCHRAGGVRASEGRHSAPSAGAGGCCTAPRKCCKHQVRLPVEMSEQAAQRVPSHRRSRNETHSLTESAFDGRMKTDQQLLQMIAQHEAPLAVVLFNIEGPGEQSWPCHERHSWIAAMMCLNKTTVQCTVVCHPRTAALSVQVCEHKKLSHCSASWRHAPTFIWWPHSMMSTRQCSGTSKFGAMQ